ncbi:MAG TPA: S-layer homology domain-containing protein [bacterium]|nr:S-layer homology domain-containing protein [bacterium]
MKRLFITIILLVLIVSLNVYSYAAIPSDVPQNHWAYEAVELLIKEGIIKGYPDGTFRGNQGITRYELAMIVAKVLEIIKSKEELQPAVEEKPATQNPQPAQEKLSLKRREILPGAYTGLVIDARGKNVTRSMSPKIYDEKGREIYGVSLFSKENHPLDEYIILGIVDYLHNESEISTSRAGSNPLIIKAVATSGPFNDDFIVSEGDGDLILKENEISKFLEDMAVAILY